MEPAELKSHLINKTVKYVVGPSKEADPVNLSTIMANIDLWCKTPEYEHSLTRLMIIPLQRFKHLRNGTCLSRDAFFVKKRHNSK